MGWRNEDGLAWIRGWGVGAATGCCRCARACSGDVAAGLVLLLVLLAGAAGSADAGTLGGAGGAHC